MGPTGCGKTELAFARVFLPVPTRIKYSYGALQAKFAEVEAADSRFEFVEGLPAYDDLPGGSGLTVMVIDS